MHNSFYKLHQNALSHFIGEALKEDLKDGDFSSLAVFSDSTIGSLNMIIKEPAVLAGVELAQKIYANYDSSIQTNILVQDGEEAQSGVTVLTAYGPVRSLLATERLVLNCMQRMSGIATLTRHLTQKIAHTNCQLLDTRKTTPNFRYPEKWAVSIGGGVNHRMGLFDMIMLKDNHIDFCGGVEKTLQVAFEYLERTRISLPVVIETRNLEEVRSCLNFPQLHRILLDNMSLDQLHQAVEIVGGNIPTEASGGITSQNLVAVAETGVNYASLGALTHSARNIDISFVAFN